MSTVDELYQRDRANPPELVELGTSDLPESVVRQELAVAVYLTTDDEDPRRGSLGYGIRLGERNNPELTPDEAEYVAKTLELAARGIRDRATG